MTESNGLRLRCEVVNGKALSAIDLELMARLHWRCLPDSMFSALGMGALCCLYRFIARSPLEAIVVARHDSGVIEGVSVASMDPQSLLRRLLVGSPMAFWVLAGSMRLPWAAVLGSKPPTAPERPELMFLFVSETCRSSGVGRKLVAQTELEILTRGRRVLTVMTRDDPKNRAIQFYETQGYRSEGAVQKFGRPFLLLSRSLD